MIISLVIPIWNGKDAIKKNLPKILEVTKFNKIDEVILPDDASTDDSVKVIRDQFPEIVLIENKINQGFGSNVNTGVKVAKGDLVILLNIDAIPDKNFLKYALPHFEDQKVFSVGCNTGGLWATAKFENGFFSHGQGKGEVNKTHQTLWVSGGSGIFRKKIWEELGGFDPLYNPFYVEDLDLGYRAWKRGYINLWEPKSRVEHAHQGEDSGNKEKGVITANFSKSKIQAISERNMLIFTWKNITSEKLINEHKKALVKMVLKHPKYLQVILAALQKWPEIMRKRKIEKKEAKISDEEILKIFAEN